jgi:hypothetical protein
MSDHLKNYLGKFYRGSCQRLCWPLLALALSSCMGASTRDPLIVGLTPDTDIVVVDGQSVRFNLALADGARIDKFLWSRSLPAQGRYEALSDLRTATVSVPFSLKDDGTLIGVSVVAADGQTDGASTKPIKVVPK